MLMIEPGCLASISCCATACATKKAARTLSDEHEIEILDLHIDERRRPVGTGIVDEDVERLRCAAIVCLHRLDVAHVERQRHRPAARARGSPRLLPRSRSLVRATQASHARPPSASAEAAAASPMPRPAPVTSARLAVEPETRAAFVEVAISVIHSAACA